MLQYTYVHMSNYTKQFTTGWTIGLIILVIFNLFMFFAPALYGLLINIVGSLDAAGILLILFFWPLFLAGAGLAIFGIIAAIIVDIVMLGVFYSAQKKYRLA